MSIKRFFCKAVVVAQLVERLLRTSKGPRFESSHQKKLRFKSFTVNCIQKTKIKNKEAGNVFLYIVKRLSNFFSPQRTCFRPAENVALKGSSC